MFAKSTSVWHLPVALLSVSLILYLLAGSWFSAWISGDFQPKRADGIYGILSPETVDALYEDARLNEALLSLTEAMAQTTENLGEKLDSDGLRSFSRNLTEQLAKMKIAQPQRRKRGLLEDLGNMITGGGNTNNQQGQQGQQGAGGVLGGLGDALGLGGGNGTGGLGGLLQQGLSGIGDSIIGGLATPALFLGIGVGMGTETGLNLTDMQQSMAVATKVAAAFNAQPTGINMVAQNLGSGLSAQLAPSLGNQTNGAQLGMAAFALAQGIGQGSASGLNLTQQQFQPTNDTSIMGIAGNFGLGVSLPIASSIDTQKLLAGAGANGGQLMQQLPQIAAAAGKGLGEGASAGLGLSKQNANPQRRQANDPNKVDIPGTVGDFSRGLSQSFLQSSDLNKALNSVAPGTGNGLNINLMGMIMPIASGAGKGIGEGAAIGLGFKADSGLAPMSGDTNSTQNTELITAEFSKSLVASFLANGTGNIALQNLTSNAGGLTMNIQAAKVAEGLARGLVEGSVNAISMVGGIENVLSGNFSLEMAMNLPAMQPGNFNDSVNGSAVAFGRGLAGEGTLLIANLITNSTKKAPKAKRDSSITEVDEFGVVPYNPMKKRQETSPGTPLAVNSSMLSSLAQAGTNAITCQGFGGIAALALGLKNSGTIKIDTKNPVPLDNQTLAALPKDPIRISSEGNTFEINIQNTDVTVNGMKILPFAIVTSLHVVLTTFAFYFALPAYLALGAIWRLSVLIGYPFSEIDNKKWRMRILLGLFLPSAVPGIILGIVGMGKAAHFRSAHGVFGLLTFLVLPPTVVASVLRLRSKAPLPPPEAYTGLKQIPKLFKSPSKIYLISALFHNFLLQFSMLAWIQGFSLLRSISLCLVDAILTAPIVVGVVSFILFLQVGAMSLVGLRIWFEGRIGKKMQLKEAIKGRVLELGSEKDLNRSDTMRTFGFNDANNANNASPESRSESRERNTRELLGREDSKIGWPSNVRKFGEEDTLPVRAVPDDNDNPFVDPNEMNERRTPSGRRLTYNEKLGGYEPEGSRDRERQTQYTVSDDNDNNEYIAYRPSSDIEPGRSAYPYFNSTYAGPSAIGGQANSAQPSGGEGSANPQRYQSFSRPRTRDREQVVSQRPSGEEIRVQYASLMPTITPPGGAGGVQGQGGSV